MGGGGARGEPDVGAPEHALGEGEPEPGGEGGEGRGGEEAHGGSVPGRGCRVAYPSAPGAAPFPGADGYGSRGDPVAVRADPAASRGRCASGPAAVPVRPGVRAGTMARGGAGARGAVGGTRLPAGGGRGGCRWSQVDKAVRGLGGARGPWRGRADGARPTGVQAGGAASGLRVHRGRRARRYAASRFAADAGLRPCPSAPGAQAGGGRGGARAVVAVRRRPGGAPGRRRVGVGRGRCRVRPEPGSTKVAG